MQITYPITDLAKYNADNNHPTLHPLVSVIDYSKASIRQWGEVSSIKFQYGLYCIFLKDIKCGDLVYGKQHYDYQDGTLVFFAPGQFAIMENPKEPYQPKGYGLIFHPDLFRGNPLAKRIFESNFFSYKTNEALHISEQEREIVLNCFEKIKLELSRPLDKHSKKLINSNIELFLNYCDRFYDRQFISREHINKSIISKFEGLVDQFFAFKKTQTEGLPSVAFFAQELNLSPNYFGDLFKRETGQSVKDFIVMKLIDQAKVRIFESNKTVNEIAYELGFKYPQHFTRLFKQKVGVSPKEFKYSNN
ncbi:MAG: hypothetical protein RJA76_778 [Bacteroidota bacterium]|jgi:AraC-like DNA-binding protein